METTPDATSEEKQTTGNKYGLPRTIPEGTKREVRQRCGFGCVICGLGLYEYEHFEPEYHEAESHEAQGITLLCPNHHARKTKGTLSIESVKKANANPKAIQQRFANEKIDLSTDNPIVILGEILFENTPTLVQIEGEPLLLIEPGTDPNEPFLLTASLKDSAGNSILEIQKNEWKTSTDNWDCKAEGQKIEIRSGLGNIELILRQEPPNTLIIERLLMQHRGWKIDAYEGKHTAVTSPSGRGFATYDCTVKGCQIGLDISKSGLGIGFGGGSVYMGRMTSGPNPITRL